MTAATEVPTLTLRERAAAGVDDAKKAQAQRYAESKARRQREELKHLTKLLNEFLDVTEAEYVVTEDGHSIAVVDGLRFRATEFDDEWNLEVALPCSRDCGHDCWRQVFGVIDLGALLAEPQAHDQPCPGQPAVEPPRPATPRERAESAVANLRVAGDRLERAWDTINRLALGRGVAKALAIVRLMQVINPETNKAHSATSAEKVVELDEEFLRYRKEEHAAEVEKWRAQTHYDACMKVADIEVVAYEASERGIG